MPKEAPSHARYMEGYNKERHRERLAESGVLAPPVTDARPNWTKFYTDLYTRLGLTSYLPRVLGEIAK